MKTTKAEKKIVSLVLIIFLIAAYLPGEILAIEGGPLPVAAFAEDVIYNGEPQVLAELNPAAGASDINPEKIKITYNGLMENGNAYLESTEPPADAGTYLVTVEYEGDDVYDSFFATEEINIKPVDLKTMNFITKKPIAKVYDGTKNVPINLIEGLTNAGVAEEDVNDVIFDFTSAEFYSKDVIFPGTNKVILKDLTISGTKAYNYVIAAPAEADENPNLIRVPETEAVDLPAEITPKPVEVFLIPEDKVYDGDAFLDECGISYNQEDVIAGDKIDVKTNEAFNPWYGEIKTRIKDVGRYYVWASEGFYLHGLAGTNINNYKIDYQQYPFTDNPAKIEVNQDTIRSKEVYSITPASVVIEPWSQAKIEGDPDPALTYMVWRDYGSDKGDWQYVEGAYGEDVFSGALSRTAGESVGEYDIFLGDLNNSNYTISFQNGESKFRIQARVPTPTVLSPPTSGQPTLGQSNTYNTETDPFDSGGLLPKLLLGIIAIVGSFMFAKMREV
ncbi:YDG domain-containing protein [Acetobacterium bakii]|uniref:MBG domain-containing protein n=1 Tax=Acetobacterium bakii TaxID=52689 RepID=A0A0L6U311_9FIRM|nr:YDG domain-containing protein [Acetobacterium bakii]KNZ42190.1 hypothetical protein AKG39_07805 [Acetobacterium bakii]